MEVLVDQVDQEEEQVGQEEEQVGQEEEQADQEALVYPHHYHRHQIFYSYF
jgi:hypothetical protein